MAVAPRLAGRIPSFELTGCSREFVEAFPARRLPVGADLKRHNLPLTAKNAQAAALRTRRRKSGESLADLVPGGRRERRRIRHGRRFAPKVPR